MAPKQMNGRAYDYNLGRFYGVDPVIQFPTNSQSLNGYSYLMNNPLAGTDPTGYCAMETGTHICSGERNPLINKIANFVRSGGKVVFEDGSTLTKSNGGSGGQGSTQKSQTDGSKGGASKIAADILSTLQAEPLDANGSLTPKSAMPNQYTFPIDEVSVTTRTAQVRQFDPKKLHFLPKPANEINVLQG